MAFCNNCGNQLKGAERFCANCGADVSGKTPSASTPSAVPTPPPSAPTPPPAAAPSATFAAAATAPPVHPTASAPVVFPQGHPTPIPVAYVPQQPAAAGQNKGLMGTLFVILVAGLIGWYFYNKAHTNTTPPATTPPATQPGPSTNPPPSTGGNGGNAALVKQQDLSANWQATNGFVVVTAKWSNNATVNLASAVMECDQYDANGTDLSQFRVTLNGPTPPNTWSSYSNVQMGAVANGMTKLACRIAHVTPAS